MSPGQQEPDKLEDIIKDERLRMKARASINAAVDEEYMKVWAHCTAGGLGDAGPAECGRAHVPHYKEGCIDFLQRRKSWRSSSVRANSLRSYCLRAAC